MSKKKAIYKYNATVKHRTWGEYGVCFIPFVFYLIICLIRPIPPVFFIGFFVSTVIGFLLLSNHNHIGIFPRFFIMGDSVILYRNVSHLFVKGSMGTELIIETKNGEKLHIKKSKFTSNARKSWKIEKHQTAKFNKVVTKILEKCIDLSENVSINVQNYKDLASFQRD